MVKNLKNLECRFFVLKLTSSLKSILTVSILAFFFAMMALSCRIHDAHGKDKDGGVRSLGDRTLHPDVGVGSRDHSGDGDGEGNKNRAEADAGVDLNANSELLDPEAPSMEDTLEQGTKVAWRVLLDRKANTALSARPIVDLDASPKLPGEGKDQKSYERRVKAFLMSYPKVFGITKESDLRFLEIVKDHELQVRNIIFQQQSNGIDVLYSTVNMILGEDDRIHLVQGPFFPKARELGYQRPRLTYLRAAWIAEVGKNANFGDGLTILYGQPKNMWENIDHIIRGLFLLGSAEYKHKSDPESDLLIYPMGREPRLAYKVSGAFIPSKDGGGDGPYDVFIDAMTGVILDRSYKGPID